MGKANCWEIKKCGREPGGAKIGEFGVCPAETETRLNGVYSGRNGGRVCWTISGTLCGGTVQGTFASKLGNCFQCNFYKMVIEEEKNNQMKTSDILDKLKK